MLKSWLNLSLLLLLTASSLPAQPLMVQAVPPDRADAQPRYVEGELLVKFRGGPSSGAAIRARAGFQHTVRRDFEFIGWQHVKLRPGLSVKDAIELYSRDPDVLAVEPNGISTIIETMPASQSVRANRPPPPAGPVIPDDPMFSQQ